MAQPCLDSLILTENELRDAKRQVQQMAYFKWQEAGRPEGDVSRQFWREAELEWIEYHYVPNRNCDHEPSGTG